MGVRGLVRRVTGRDANANDAWDHNLFPEDVVDAYRRDPDFPYLVSWPRTGSHWLRAVMELTFGMPALVRAIYYPDARTFSCIHAHDLDLDLVRRRVIYLHRDPVDTVYSAARYWRIDHNNHHAVQALAVRYGLHRKKWLDDEEFTTEKAVLTYGQLRDDPVTALSVVGDIIGRPADPAKVRAAVAQATKPEVASRTRYDKSIVSLDRDPEAFRESMGDLVMSAVYRPVWR